MMSVGAVNTPHHHHPLGNNLSVPNSKKNTKKEAKNKASFDPQTNLANASWIAGLSSPLSPNMQRFDFNNNNNSKITLGQQHQQQRQQQQPQQQQQQQQQRSHQQQHVRPMLPTTSVTTSTASSSPAPFRTAVGSNYLSSPGHIQSTQPQEVQQQAVKPPYSFPCLIGLALRTSRPGQMSVSQIYEYVTRKFPYFRTAKPGWKNSIRHNLSLNKVFCKFERKPGDDGKGALWGVAPGMQAQLDRDIAQCQQRFPQKIEEAMKEPTFVPSSYAANNNQHHRRQQQHHANPPKQTLGMLGKSHSAPVMSLSVLQQMHHMNEQQEQIMQNQQELEQRCSELPMHLRRFSLPGDVEMFDVSVGDLLNDVNEPFMNPMSFDSELPEMFSTTETTTTQGGSLEDFVPELYDTLIPDTMEQDFSQNNFDDLLGFDLYDTMNNFNL